MTDSKYVNFDYDLSIKILNLLKVSIFLSVLYSIIINLLIIRNNEFLSVHVLFEQFIFQSKCKYHQEYLLNIDDLELDYVNMYPLSNV